MTQNLVAAFNIDAPKDMNIVREELSQKKTLTARTDTLVRPSADRFRSRAIH